MRTFTDKNGLEWNLDFGIENILDVCNATLCQFALFAPNDLIDGQPFADKLATDVTVFLDVLWLIVKSQADRRLITAEMFGEAMADECIWSAFSIFWDAWHEFIDSFADAVTQKDMCSRAKAWAMSHGIQLNRPVSQDATP